MRSILDPEQHGHVLAYAEDAHLWFKERGPNDGFPTWEALGVPAFDPVTIDPQAEQIPDDVWSFIFMCGAAHADGRIDVVGTVNDIGDSRDVFYRSRPAGGTVWADWERLEDNGFDGDIVAAVAGDDGLDVVTPVDFIVAIGVQEIDMSYRRRGPDGTWTPWALLGRPQGGFTDDVTPVLILGPGGLELFAVSATNVICEGVGAAAMRPPLPGGHLPGHCCFLDRACGRERVRRWSRPACAGASSLVPAFRSLRDGYAGRASPPLCRHS